MTRMGPDDVLSFWFTELSQAQWWENDPELDSEIRTRFDEVHTKATKGELYSWRANARGSLAEIIILDQFSRNMFRESPKAYAYDSLALCLAQNAILLGHDKKLSDNENVFLYMPYMHSESIAIHEDALELFTALGKKDQLSYELQYFDIIKRFGRFPHRNAILGITSTAEELQLLNKR